MQPKRTRCCAECALECATEGFEAVEARVERGVEHRAKLTRSQAVGSPAQAHQLHVARDWYPHIGGKLTMKMELREVRNAA
jgi:hypothetical protein